jgi:hypothetical protein
MARLYADLLACRREHAALRPGLGTVTVTTAPEATAIQVRARAPGAADVVVVYNVAAVETSMPLPPPGAWRLVLDTDALAYGGHDRTRCTNGLALPPWTAVALLGETA